MFELSSRPKSATSASLFRSLLLLSCSGLILSNAPLATAENLTIDFRKLYTAADPQFLSAEEVEDYFLSLDTTSDLINGVPVANMVYGHPKGIGKIWSSYSTDGAIFIQATDSETKEDTGELSLIVNPSYRHRNTNLNIYIYKDPTIVSSQDLPAKLDVSINGQPYQEATRTDNKNGVMATFNIKPNGTIIKEISLKVPNACRNKKDNTLSPADEDYFMAITHLNLYYGEDTPEAVTSWTFENGSQTVNLNQAATYKMPVLKSVPEDAVNVAVFTSSNPEVAEIKNERVILKNPGITTITAAIPANSLFHPSASYQPASFNLTVENSDSKIEEIFHGNQTETIYFDMQGKTIPKPTAPGIYIKKVGTKTEKYIVR